MSLFRDTTSGAPGRGRNADFFFIDLEFVSKIFVRLSMKHATKKEA